MDNFFSHLTGMTHTKLTISLTGHRPPRLAGYNLHQDYYRRLHVRLRDILVGYLQEVDHLECHSGMALGADTIWAQVIQDVKEDYPGRITFVADIPDNAQASRWPRSAQETWKELVKKADRIQTYDQDPHLPYPAKLNKRNIGMIQACDKLIAIYDGQANGGTANAVRDAKKADKFVIYIHPDTI